MSPRPLISVALALVACGGSGGGTVHETPDGTSACSNGALDPGETDVDCGGACGACADGRACVEASDCASGFCSTYVCRAAACNNGTQDITETGVDCGGGCPACNGEGCTDNIDCATGYCRAGVCDVPTCRDGVKNGAETGVDCGGACDLCAVGGGCLTDANCATGYCRDRFCATPTCSDQVLNQNETDVDCGGVCPGCADGKACVGATDCASGVCEGGACAVVPPSCDDGVKNGSETDVDCGAGCPGCGYGDACTLPTDCVSERCEQGACAEAASCDDGVKSGSESDADCGGDCKGCAIGQLCDGHSDCLSATCIYGVCATPTCDDEVRNQHETDVDCGGGCPACDDGRSCVEGADCASARCTGGVCTSCEDGARNGPETDVDCGGTCSACADGDTCAAPSDCASARCTGGVCTSCEDGARNGPETDVDCGGTCSACADGDACAVPSDCASGYCCGGACVPGTGVDHCGGCAACDTDPHGVATCDGTSCGVTCTGGYHLCDGGCVDDHAVATCGDGCSPCPTDPNGAATCDGSACGVACDTGYHLCGGACADDTATASCGSACSPCPTSIHGTATCDGTTCGIDCDPGYHLCGGTCVSDASVDHCGASCTPCAPAGANATLSCQAGACTYSCVGDTIPCGVECLTSLQMNSRLIGTMYNDLDFTEAGRAMVPAADGSLLVVGYTSASANPGNYGVEPWVTKLEADSTVAWQTTVGPAAEESHWIQAATGLPTGGWLVGGTTFFTSSKFAWIATVSADGVASDRVDVAAARTIATLAPLVGGGILAVGGKASSSGSWYGRIDATGAVAWEGILDLDNDARGAALPGGGSVIAAPSSAGGSRVRFLDASGAELVTASVAGIRVRDVVGLPGGGAALIGATDESMYKPLVLRVDAAGEVVATEPGPDTGAWTRGAWRPGGGLVLGGYEDYAHGWNPLLFGLSDADGGLAWTRKIFNLGVHDFYEVAMNDAVVLPTGGYAWLATTDEDYGVDYQDVYAFRIDCEGAAPPSQPTSSPIVISELLYDAVGSDDDVFVELHGPAGASLSGYTLVGVNGNGGGDYKAVSLSGTIGADGIYLVANTSATGVIASAADQTADVDYQNGPDSVQLRDAAGGVVDAVGYGVFGADNVFAGEGTAAPTAGPGSSLTRDSAATDTGNNAADFSVDASPTPGSP